MVDEDDDPNERHWINGHRAAWRGLLGQAIRELRGDGVELEDPELRAGDNDWPDNLHLGDVIKKHLACYLDDRNAFDASDT